MVKKIQLWASATSVMFRYPSHITVSVVRNLSAEVAMTFYLTELTMW
jgi:hypothetical protein